MEPVFVVLAGLGLFFTGVKFIAGNLSKMTGRRFRQFVLSFTRTPQGAAAAGVLSGTLTQSTSAVTFIAISLMSAGMLSARRAVALVTWSNVGTSALVLLAIIDVRLLVLALVALTGLCFHLDLDKSGRFRHLLGAMLGLSLLFLGIDMMKSGAEPLRETDGFQYAVAISTGFLSLVFAVGAVGSLLTQSSATISVIAVTMTQVGLLTVEQTLLMVYGASVGSGLNIMFLTAGLSGAPRALALTQLWAKMGGVLVMLPLFVLERYADIPLVIALIEQLADGLRLQIAWGYLLLQLVSALIMTAATPLLTPLLQRMAQDSDQLMSDEPVYLYDQARDDPPTAVELVRKELQRLVGHLPFSLDDVRPLHERTEGVDPRLLRESDRAVLDKLERFITDLIDGPHARDTLNDILIAQQQAHALRDLQAGLAQLVDEVGRTATGDDLSRLTRNIVEALHALLGVLDDSVAGETAEDRDIVLRISGDRSEMIDRIRRQFLDGAPSMNPEQQRALFAVTGLYERIVWLVRSYVRAAELTAGALPTR